MKSKQKGVGAGSNEQASQYREVNSSLNVSKPKIKLLEPIVQAVDFSLPRINSTEHFDLHDYLGNVVLLIFWNSSDYMSQAAVLHLESWYRKNSRSAFIAIAINCDAFKPKYKLDGKNISGITQLWDQEGYVEELYRINSFPSTVLIDRKGQIRDEKSGGPINDWLRLTQRINDVSAE